MKTPNGNFLIYPGGHFDIWEEMYFRKYRVDYDFYPRGRVAYNTVTETYEILYDKCIGEQINSFVSAHFEGKPVSLGFDEHYKCRKCNKGYVI